ncbi:hypothetical protein EJ110_NYTH50232 [Nymphaea thermarum]|nr:hypothetical protein EJ110_NYTH50232 [Nymphaea thermarum]
MTAPDSCLTHLGADRRRTRIHTRTASTEVRDQNCRTQDLRPQNQLKNKLEDVNSQRRYSRHHHRELVDLLHPGVLLLRRIYGPESLPNSTVALET